MIAENESDKRAYPLMDEHGLTFDARHRTQPNQTPAHLGPAANRAAPTAAAKRGTVWP